MTGSPEPILIRRFNAKITLIARRALPARATWPATLANHDPSAAICRRILALQRLEKLGGEVFVAAADVCNLQDMRAAVDAGTQRFGARTRTGEPYRT